MRLIEVEAQEHTNLLPRVGRAWDVSLVEHLERLARAAGGKRVGRVVHLHDEVADVVAGVKGAHQLAELLPVPEGADGALDAREPLPVLPDELQEALLDLLVKLLCRRLLFLGHALQPMRQEGGGVVQTVEEDGVEVLELLRQEHLWVVGGDHLEGTCLPAQNLDRFLGHGVGHVGPQAAPDEELARLLRRRGRLIGRKLLHLLHVLRRRPYEEGSLHHGLALLWWGRPWPGPGGRRLLRCLRGQRRGRH